MPNTTPDILSLVAMLSEAPVPTERRHALMTRAQLIELAGTEPDWLQAYEAGETVRLGDSTITLLD